MSDISDRDSSVTIALTEEVLRDTLSAALAELESRDSHLFRTNNSERCLVARLALYLQVRLRDWSVDVEYSRDGNGVVPKRIALNQACANKLNEKGGACVIPDLIVHKRGPEGPNLLVIEAKKSTNRTSRECDHLRLLGFQREFSYVYAALIEFETARGTEAKAHVSEWIVRQSN